MGYVRAATPVITVCLALLAGRGGGASGPARLLPDAATKHSVALSWTASTSPDVVGYNVYRTTASSGRGRSKHPVNWQKITSNPRPETTYTDKTVLSKTTYYYAVTAVDSKGRESAFCQWIRATVP